MSELIAKLEALLGEKGVFHGERLKERHFPGAAPFTSTSVEPFALVRPTSTEEVSAILKICHAAGQPVVPHGGLTGLVDGTTSNSKEVAITLERMNKIEEIDVESRTMTVQAGVPLQLVQEAAENADLLFPLDLGARGTATIGGNVSTNAGGNRVIRYGMMRDQVLGMEVVLADGTIISSMNKIIKNNTGYDIKQLFMGAEGTLGIVTRVVLRVRPMPRSQDMAFIAVNEFSQVTSFLNYVDSALGGTLSAFEVLWQDYYKLVTSPPAEASPPLSHEYNYYILLEAMGGDPTGDADRFVEVLSKSLEDGVIADAVIAQSQSDRDSMWAIRDDVGQVAQNWPIFTFDISVSLNKMESYVEEMQNGLDEQWETNSCMIFGHLGDGNLHIIVGVGDDSIETKKAVEETVYRGLTTRGGSVSAEHGIGLQKKHYLSWSRSEDEIALMLSIKKALDPKDILNPGKI
ncbi:MAG: FAD-binding oxidoreductase, partial [Gammaproteobacteria bacterium]|nr:FAD-binding oxidoreductase [Gammaproteobacteria bacterium]